jgi:hypothetical protein
MTEDAENIGQEFQEAHVTADGESSSLVYHWNTRCKLMDILEDPATAQAQEEAADSVGTGSIGAPTSLGFIEKEMENIWTLDESQLIMEQLGTRGL